MKLKFFLPLALIPILILPAFALSEGMDFENFCEKKTTNKKTTAADFICELDIFQMKSDIDTLKGNPVEIIAVEEEYNVINLEITGSPDTFMDLGITYPNGNINAQRILTDSEGKYVTYGGSPFGVGGNFTAIVTHNEYSNNVEYSVEKQPKINSFYLAMEKALYEGDSLEVIGTVIDYDEKYPTVLIQISTLDESIIESVSASIQDDNTFSYTFTLGGDGYTYDGLYIAKATYGNTWIGSAFDYQEIPPATSEITIEPASGSGASGCEETVEGCYIPNIASVDLGDTIIFSNTDGDTFHTFTAGTSADGSTGEFNSGIIASGDSYEWTADVEGEIPYYCTIHTWMTGVIKVEV